MSKASGVGIFHFQSLYRCNYKLCVDVSNLFTIINIVKGFLFSMSKF